MLAIRGILIFIYTLISGVAFSQALGTDPEAGRGTYKNRTFFNLERYWDTAKLCDNPHKGWSIHYYDNGITNYGNRLSPSDSLKDFPCLNDIYLRLAWSYLEPKEHEYNWILIDSIIDRWVKWGHTISFRITCKETEIAYATPEWVRKAGAKGSFIDHKELTVRAWAPDYGDPVFLSKLENFHRAFAARYDGKPWVEYIDIGSMGDWGEGHTAYSGWKDIPVASIKKHVDLFKRCYKKSVLIISDDIMGQRDLDDGADIGLFKYFLSKGIGFRDDSGNVEWYKNLGFGSDCIRTPELYSAVYKNIPVILESDHYGDAKENGMWGDGSGFEKAVRETHASLVGFHYYPREWLNENALYARRVANLSGYWYFPRFVLLPDTLRQHSSANYLRITWENHGVAPAYHRYKVLMKLADASGVAVFSQPLPESDNRTWMPGETIAEQYALTLKKGIAPGKYSLLIGMRDECGFHNRSIGLGLNIKREMEPGWYKVGEVFVR